MVTKRTGKTVAKVRKDMLDSAKNEIKAAKPKKQTWEQFIREIQC
jgi:hypothetical protein